MQLHHCNCTIAIAPSTPRKLLLTELGLLPLQVFWWRQTLQFWNGLASLPIGSLYHNVCLDNLTDAFQLEEGTCNLANSLAACLHSVGFEMPRVHDVVPLLDVDGVVEALTARLQSSTLPGSNPGSLSQCIVLVHVQPPLRVLLHAHTGSGLSLIAHVGGIVSFLFLGGACSDFCSLGWAVMACGLLLAVWLVLGSAGHLGRANRFCLACNSGGVSDEKHMIFECTALAPLRQQHADLFTPRTVTMRSFFAQQNHLAQGVLNYVTDCLNFMNI